MAFESSFETMCFNPVLANDSLNDSNQNPDVNFYKNISSLGSNYLPPSEIDKNFKNFSKESFSTWTSEVWTKISRLFKIFTSP